MKQQTTAGFHQAKSYDQQQQPLPPPHTAVPIADPQGQSTSHPQRYIPRLDLFQGGSNRKKCMEIGVPLYEAAIIGDWNEAKRIFDSNPELELVRFAITETQETLLHIAASAESSKWVDNFMKNLVDMMKEEDLMLQNTNFNTALNLAAAAGNLKTVKILLEKNKHLIDVPTHTKMTPLIMAALFAKPDVVRYLYEKSNKMSGDSWDGENRPWVLQKCVESEIFDVALQIVEDLSQLLEDGAVARDVLIALAQNTSAFNVKKQRFFFRTINSILAVFCKRVTPDEKRSELALKLLRKIWKTIASTDKNNIDKIIRGPSKVKEGKKIYPSRVLFLAVKMGNISFIIELIRLYPELIWKKDEKQKTIFHLAAKRRQIKIYKLLYEIGSMKDLITPLNDIKGNNMLHMVAKSAKKIRYQDVSGVAFQMHQELLWFKVVKEVIPPEDRLKKNNENQTPQDLFTKSHKELLKESEEWMKDTASQCMVVATLIATIVFAAAFTLPGGYNQNTGIPFFRKEPALIIFVISDAISLVSSTTSILMFLSYFGLTSRYAERDFQGSLPRKLVNGLATLFLSIITMMIAFGASFFVLYSKKVKWIPITITSLAGIPVILYLMLQYSLMWDVFKSAYISRNLFKRKERILYRKKHYICFLPIFISSNSFVKFIYR